MTGRSDRGHGRLAVGLGVISLGLWPFSYAWIPTAGQNPIWVGILVPVAEWGAVACAIAAIWLGRRASQSNPGSPASVWAPRLGALTLVLMIAAFIVVASQYRD